MSKQNRQIQGVKPRAEEPALLLNIRIQRGIRWLVIICVLIELLFVYLDYTINLSYWSELGPIRRLFNITREDGMPSWFSVTLTSLAALTLWFIYAVENRLESSKWTKTGWMILALFFTYITLDDGSDLHERVGTAIKEIQARVPDQSGPSSLLTRAIRFSPSYTWQVIFAPIFGSLGIFTFVFLWCKFQSTRRRLALLFAFGIMGVALGLDFVEGLAPEHKWNIYTIIADKYDLNAITAVKYREMAFETLRHFSKSLEEFLEMLAMTILLASFLGYLGATSPRINLRFKAD